ncbi:amidohydrolase family protein-like protein [Lophiotrema nucula]|uniref:Amidohydrolase family protein-like protein n=1 Tax=Lophiotrema nucula TaxID=690887 RepID=A0A6A5Z2K8_9PLEO|nr:amidohydrolase family protein-like protein [Lophiotrema nucula]
MTSTSNGTIFTNGRFFQASQDATAATFHSNLVVRDGKIAYIGDSTAAEIEKYDSQGFPTQDLQGKHVLPGFIDGHMHFLMLGSALHKLSLDGSKDLTEIRARITDFAKQNPDKKRILCRGWMHSMTDGKAEASMLDDLDPRPIYIDSKDLHSTWCNTAALEEMQVHDIPDPAGGSISRDANGKPSGLLSEASVLLIVWPHLAQVASMEEKMSALKSAIAAYHEVGVTGCIDMAMDENAWEAILAFRDAEGGSLPMRMAAHWCITPSSTDSERLKQVDRAIHLAHQHNSHTSPDLRIVGIKVICDGVIDACTAALSSPYSTNVTSPDPIWSAAMLDPVVEKACNAGLQCALHAIGDAAVTLAINSLEKYGKPGQRHRIEHLELTSPSDAKRLGALGITASIQPVHADPAILRAWPKLLGPERLKRAFAYKEFADNGAVLAIGSDAPTAPHAPIKNLYVGTTRRSAREPEGGDEPVNEHFKLGICEAVSAATLGSAYSCFADERVGSLEVGKEADFVVVDMQFEAEGLLKAVVKQTWVGGKKVYEA